MMGNTSFKKVMFELRHDGKGSHPLKESKEEYPGQTALTVSAVALRHCLDWSIVHQD